eukprot:jgi/Botrbrau1/10202/Bobra.116_1s0018.1
MCFAGSSVPGVDCNLVKEADTGTCTNSATISGPGIQPERATESQGLWGEPVDCDVQLGDWENTTAEEAHLDLVFHASPACHLSNAGASQNEARVDVRHEFMDDILTCTSWTGMVEDLPYADVQLTILVCGQEGVGKTTFIHNLKASYGVESDQCVKESNIFSQPRHGVTRSHSSGKRITHFLQDSQGFNTVEGAKFLVDGIEALKLQYCCMEEDPKRSQAMHRLEDPRVHVCLYFLSPWGSAIDIPVMESLSRVAPIIPVIAKADSYTNEELHNFREKVVKAVSDSGICIYPFDENALERAGWSQNQQIFAVMGSQQYHDVHGRGWPVRKYTWGQLEIWSRMNSDVMPLRSLLMESATAEGLMKATEEHFHRYRQKRLEELGKVLKKERDAFLRVSKTAQVWIYSTVLLSGFLFITLPFKLFPTGISITGVSIALILLLSNFDKTAMGVFFAKENCSNHAAAARTSTFPL